MSSIRQTIEAVGARLVYLLPYSPDGSGEPFGGSGELGEPPSSGRGLAELFNSIENCWSKVKELLRSRGARTYAQLDQAITDALDTITTHDITGWFTHCCYCIASD